MGEQKNNNKVKNKRNNMEHHKLSPKKNLQLFFTFFMLSILFGKRFVATFTFSMSSVNVSREHFDIFYIFLLRTFV